jgi:hypothetical protein
MALVNPIKEQNKNNHLSFEQKLDLIFESLYKKHGEPPIPISSVATRCGFNPSKDEKTRLDVEVINHYTKWYKLSNLGHKNLSPFNGSYSKYLEAKKQSEQQEKQSYTSVHVGGNFFGNLNTGQVTGNQEASFAERPAEYPKTQPMKAAKKITPITIMVSLVKVISSNPLISGIIAMIIGTLILKYYGLI